MVVRGGAHDVSQKSRPFTVAHMTPNGPAFLDGTLRTGDRIIAVNAKELHTTKLPELQSLLYRYATKFFYDAR